MLPTVERLEWYLAYVEMRLIMTIRMKDTRIKAFSASTIALVVIANIVTSPWLLSLLLRLLLYRPI